MPTENFISSNVVIGSILNAERSIRLDPFISPTGDAHTEFKNFIELTKDKKCLFDVGCADGILSFGFCSTNDKISHAFDASHQLQLSIIETIAKNPDKRIVYHKLFLGNDDVIRQYNSSGLQSYATGGSDTVVMITMDSFCALTDVIPDTIKIDTEGYEYNVLTGGKQVILSYRPLIFVELHPKFTSMYGTNISQVFDLKKELNYSVNDIFGKEITLETVMQSNVDSIRTVWHPN
jgi:FkbM family methyltransferase